MTAAGPWSVKGIDPKAREIAKDLARRSGMTLGEWLNQMIIEGGEPEPPPYEPPSAPAYAEVRRRGLDDLYREARSARPVPTPPSRTLDPYFAPPPAPDALEVGRAAQALSDLSLRMEAAEHRSTLAISGIDQSVMGVLSRLDDIERDQGTGHARLDSSVAEVRAAQAQVTDRLRRLEHEDSGRVEALKALESALGRIVNQMQQGEAVTDRSRQALDDLSRRVEQVETSAAQAASSYADAEKVETVLSRMAERLDQAETRTSAAVQSLQTAFAGLDARLRQGESRHGLTGAELERRFQGLAEELSQRVEASRNELAQRLRSAADGRLDRLEGTLREIKGQVDQAEQRSAQAIERISREVMRVAQGLGERVAAAEHQGKARAAQADARIAAVEGRSAAAVETLGGEVARIADVMESRMRQADGAQAQAMEKLGGEIARIAERLADRISSSDRRSAEAIDEVSDKVAKISERMDERQTRSVSELADRIRQSEERTAKLLEEARERLDQRLGARVAAPPMETPVPQPRTPAPPVEIATAFDAAAAPLARQSNTDPFGMATPPAPGPAQTTATHAPPARPSLPAQQPAPPPLEAAAAAPAPAPDFAADDFALDNDPFAHRSAFASELSPFDPDDDFAPAPHQAPAPQAPAASLAPPPLAATASPLPFLSEPTAPQAESTAPPPAAVFGHAHTSAATAAATQPASPDFMGFSVRDFAPEAAASEPGQMSTREMLEAARQAAKRAAGRPDAVPAPTPDAPRAPRPFGLTLPGRRKKETAPTLRTLALAALTAGAATTAVLGAHKLGSVNGGLDAGDLHGLDHADLAATAPTAAPPPAPANVPATPSLAVALTPISVPDGPPAKKPDAKPTAARSAPAPVEMVAKAAAPSAKSPHALYANAIERIEGGDLTGVADLKKAAAGGDVDAQFYLARLYDAGGSGLPKDLSEARRWTQKAAEGGDALAMYNYASYAYAGDGGPKDVAGAVTWFRRSAEHGVVNGQYNLAQLYEKGYGVPQDAVEAYKWYLAAASSGDAGAKAAATALKSKLAPDALARAEKAAGILHAQADDNVKTAKAAAPAAHP